VAHPFAPANRPDVKLILQGCDGKLGLWGNLPYMGAFWKYVFPGLYGLLIYTTIRILNDTVSEFKVWERAWTISAIEILFTLVTGYVTIYAFNRLFKRFDKQLQQTFSYKTVLYELSWVFILSVIIVNAIMTPMVALTDDGLSWGDFATLMILPLLFNLLYYAIVRSNKLLQAYVNNKLQLEKLTNDHLQTELKFLKAQYHPHFLFNALNTIYFQMDENIPAAKKSIDKFSELLRYQLYDQQQTVPVSHEIHYLQNYIDLQKIRSSEKLKLQVYFDESLNGQQVYPLLFLPLVENAFKYVGGDYCISIEARAAQNRICFTVKNSLPDGTGWMMDKNDIQKRSGIGLENLKRRLELLYPSKHAFTTGQQENYFCAAMQLELN
jgi:two-component system LytT family sensor kinase